MKKSLILLLYFFIIPFTYCLGQGLIFISEDFILRQEINKDRSDFVPSRASLKAYTPYTLSQQNSTCVAYSVSTARGMLYAINNNLIEKDLVTVNMFSPHWIYYRNKEVSDINCNLGLNIEHVMSDLLNVGVPKMAFVEYPDYYPFTEIVLCNYYPPTYGEDLKEAYKGSVSDVYRITDLDGIKLAISQKMPTVLCMLVPTSFSDANNIELWRPSTNDNVSEAYGHAMVIVGYDDDKFGGACEIMNSWGVGWGINGYIWIKYEDLISYTLGAYALNNNLDYSDSNPKSKDDFIFSEANIGSLSVDKVQSSKNVQDTLIIQKYSGLIEKFKNLHK